ncbi:baculoviral IAP repeat-containing protein 7-B-like isoform X2 [Cloeon dipterum]|uniref:baculoviral IAP repeat-containing protein 7-B-like isoform X2 n=1 Tax=Cloeon dipterum TaxID=197152 RepID=UPI0032202D9D
MSDEDSPSESTSDAQVSTPGPSSGCKKGPEMNYEKRRLETFQSWPPNAAVDCGKIAKAGFYYTGNELEVQCFSCNRTLSNWEYNDQVMVKHRALNPECPFVINPLECGNVPILRRESSAGFSQAQVDYRIESERLASYRGWSSPHVTPEALARNGLYYLREGDKVACAFCSVQIYNWKAGDDPIREHRGFSPNCPLLMGYMVGNVPLDETGSGVLIDHGEDDDNYEIVSTSSDDDDDEEGGDVYGIRNPPGQLIIHPFSGPDELSPVNMDNVELSNNPRFGAVAHRPPIHPNYQTVQARLASFSGWPRATPTPDALAAAGFFYQGMNDHASCFHCNGGLHNWDPMDDPWMEHARWFSLCPYINITKGQDYVKEMVRNKPPIISVAELNLQPPPPPANGGVQPENQPEESRNNVAEEEQEEEQENGQAERENEEVVGAAATAAALEEEGVRANDEDTETEAKNAENCEASHRDRDKEETREPPTKDEEEPKETEVDKSTTNEAHLCKVCLDEDVGVVFLPCGHLVTCVQCAPNLSLCPVCRKEIKASVRTYFS